MSLLIIPNYKIKMQLYEESDDNSSSLKSYNGILDLPTITMYVPLYRNHMLTNAAGQFDGFHPATYHNFLH